MTGNKAYGPDGGYKGTDLESLAHSSPFRGLMPSSKVFAGKDASRALAQSSLKPEDCRSDWYDLADEHKKVLTDWHTFFSKRYNIKGTVEGATNT